MNGFINVDKPKGLNSTSVVNYIKRTTGLKCGHMGTLDPMASGVLPVALGHSTRLFDALLLKKKTYIACVTFGYQTDSLDTEGKVIISEKRIPDLSEVTHVLPSFEGEIKQVPPLFSAKNVDGKRSYVLARRGIDFSLPPKTVNIYSVKLLDYNGGTARIEVVCGGGTYIRSLARDIAEKLDTVATLTDLRRTASGAFELDNAVPFEEFKTLDWTKCVLSSDYPLMNLPEVRLSPEEEKKLIDGVFVVSIPDGDYRVYGKEFLGLGYGDKGLLKMKAYLR